MPTALRAYTRPPIPRPRLGTRILRPAAVTLANPVWTAEGGSNGTDITVANSGGASGTPFDAVVASATCTKNYDSTHAAHGTLSFGCVLGGTAGESYVTWSTALTPSAVGTVFARAYCYLTGYPAAGANVNLFRILSVTTARASITIVPTTGFLAARDSAGTAQATATGACPLNAWFRVEAQIIGSATTGQIIIRRYDTPDSIIPTETVTTAATINTGGTIDTIRYGHSGTAVASYTYWLDDLGASLTDWPGPSVVAPAAWPPPLESQYGGYF